MKLVLGDSFEKLKELDDNSVDSIVTDAPYGFAFMGKKWDYELPRIEIWQECLRVLKPGGHLLCFGGPRTYHRMACGVEDAGFEIRDQLQWLFGSGFPKSLNISKAIDKAACLERPRIQGGVGSANTKSLGKFKAGEAISGEAKEWDGWGTALKPAHEEIVLARKPLTIADEFNNLVLEICQLELFVTAVKKSFSLSQKEQNEALNIVQWIAGKSTLTLADLFALTDILRLRLMANSSLSIELLWLVKLAEILRVANTFITETALSLIIDLKTLRYLLSRITQENTHPSDGHGQSADALLVENYFSVLELKLKTIHIHSALERATEKDALVNLRPSNEPIVLARKPLSEKTVSANVLKWGTGGLNIDASRIENDGKSTSRPVGASAYQRHSGIITSGAPAKYEIKSEVSGGHAQGRFPANLLLDEEAAEVLDAQQADVSRFFYVAKVSSKERNAGCEDLEEKDGGLMDERPSGDFHTRLGDGPTKAKKNNHPTVKPKKLMAYLIKLITPPGGTVLDPFMGSGSTGVAAKETGFQFIGIEREAEYFEIAEKRIHGI